MGNLIKVREAGGEAGGSCPGRFDRTFSGMFSAKKPSSPPPCSKTFSLFDPLQLTWEITYPSTASFTMVDTLSSLPSKVLTDRPLISQKLCFLQEKALGHAGIFTSVFHGKVQKSYSKSSHVIQGQKRPSATLGPCSLLPFRSPKEYKYLEIVQL